MDFFNFFIAEDIHHNAQLTLEHIVYYFNVSQIERPVQDNKIQNYRPTCS